MWEAKTNDDRMLVIRNHLIEKIYNSQTFIVFDLEFDESTVKFSTMWFGRLISWSFAFSPHELETICDLSLLTEKAFNNWERSMTDAFGGD